MHDDTGTGRSAVRDHFLIDSGLTLALAAVAVAGGAGRTARHSHLALPRGYEATLCLPIT